MGIADPSKLSTIIGLLISSFELSGKVIKFAKKVWRGFSNEGIYEVLDYEARVEILDPKGKKAKVEKNETIRFLQDGLVAIEDEAWGDGKYLVNYKVSPGKAADIYRVGYRSIVLISLRDVKNKGDVETFGITWEIENGFQRENEQWETKVNHRTKNMNISVILPQKRTPKQAQLVEVNRKRSRPLKTVKELPDKRWEISVKIDKPQLYETYLINWTW